MAVAARLLHGTVHNWADLGEPPAPMHLIVGPQAGESTLGPASAPVRPPDVVIAVRDEDAMRGVERDFNALAFVAATVVGPGVRTLSVGGHDPIRAPSSYPFRVRGTEPGAVVTALAVGDLMLARNVYDKLRTTGDFSAPFRATAGRISAADIAFGNLEGTVSCAGSRQQFADSFAMVPLELEGLTRAGFDVVTLANSHIGDFGRVAVTQTVQRLGDAGLKTVGAGADESQARSSLIIVRNGVRFGFLAFNGAGWSPPAGPSTPGTVDIRMGPYAPFSGSDLASFLSEVRRLRSAVDVLIVYPHWGQQYTFMANHDQRLVAHAIVDAGADMVIGTHPHWIQGAEIYHGKLIEYSLGNFVFDMEWSLEVREGLALELTFWGPDLKRAEFLPLLIGGWTDSYQPRFVSGQVGHSILERLWGASEQPFRLSRPRPTEPATSPRLSKVPSGLPC